MMNMSRFLRTVLAGATLVFFAPGALAECSPMPDCAIDDYPITVTLTSPATGATSTAPGSFTLSANAADPDATVVAVEFYSNNVSVGIDSTAPYSMSLGGLAAGTYAIKAKATNDISESVTSPVRTVTVNPAGNLAPTVAMTAPANNSSATAPATLSLTASASDSDGSIASVVFKSGSTTLGSPDTTYPYSYTYSGVGVGIYTFTAVATDNNGATATSAPITVTVNSGSGVSPTATLTAPAGGGTYAFGAPIAMTATASDTDGSVAKVQFLANSVVVGTDLSAPYAYTYAPTAGGSYNLKAVAFDNTGSTGVSNSVTVTVAAPSQVSETRRYVYDEYHRLCKTINPESGAAVINYDAASNIIWTAEGQNLPDTTNCNRESVPDSAKISREYDDLNRVTKVLTPNGTADVLTQYELDGAVQKLTAYNPGGNTVVTDYVYNKRRLLVSETQTNEQDPALTNDTVAYTVTYEYNANGHLKKIGYPDTEFVDYAPDALGRPTQVVGTSATYATGVQYYPNGAMSAFKYGPASGGGPTHEMTQNTRQLPAHSKDYKGTTIIVDDTYSYDNNGNVTDILDAAQAGAASQTRGMAYDDLDRLTAAVGPWGDATYSYDALDNLKSADQGNRQYRYVYDSTTWRLSSINTPAGANVYSFGYDTRGNTITKGNQGFGFDIANRMSSATTMSGTAGTQSYRYDGLGRRVQTTDPGASNPPKMYWLYTQAGQVLYTSEGRRNQNVSYIYLNGSQVATRAKAFTTGIVTVRYQMTDALGSPVASTNLNASAASIQRTSYTPWGEASPIVDGTSYTGHVSDANTGLTYMQQRYYDQMVGRFLSKDPIATSARTGGNWNSYWYAANNPTAFLDRDGRQAESARSYGTPHGDHANGDYSSSPDDSLADLDSYFQFGADKQHPMSKTFISDMRMMFRRMVQRAPETKQILRAGKADGLLLLVQQGTAEDGYWKGIPVHQSKVFFLFANPAWTVRYQNGGAWFYNPTWLDLFHEILHFGELIGRTKFNPLMRQSEETRVTARERQEALKLGMPGRRGHDDGEPVPAREVDKQ